MNRAKTYLALVAIFLPGIASETAMAATAVVDAGKLTSPSGASMQVDNNSFSPNGSLLLLIDLGSSNAVNNSLTPGSYVAGTNTILAAGGFNNNGGTNETLTEFQIVGTANPGDLVALRWFPQITYAQYQSGTLPVAGDYFGTYNPNGGNPDGNEPWTVPAASATVDLTFLTTNADSGGTQPPASGFAGDQVTASGTNPFSAWQSTYFTAQQIADPTYGGATATPLNDGVPNLLKYLYDINPDFPMSAADRAALPSVQSTDNGGLFTLTYRENPAAVGLTIHAQTSLDLAHWSNVTSTQVSTDPLTGDFIMQAQVSVTSAQQFLRLDVSSP